MGDTTTETRARRREERANAAAALTAGPNELLDFILPLWAGVAVGASATEVGVLVALEALVSLVLRPYAGVLADTGERGRVAALGALLYGLSCLGYAFAGSMPIAYAAAVVGGAGGALLWVSLRAMAGERLSEDSGVYSRLLESESTGTWIAFVAGVTLLNVIDYRGVFALCAAACLCAAIALVTAPVRAPRDDASEPVTGGLRLLGRRLRPMLGAVAITMAAEAAIGMLLLLHLQRGLGLETVLVAYVFLPGAIVMSIVPAHMHRVVVRFGRTRVLAAGSVASAGFAASLAWAPNEYWIAGLWVLSGVAWATLLPIQQAVISEASGRHTGRGMGLYESATLVGAFVGALAAGVLYDTSSWRVACLACAR